MQAAYRLLNEAGVALECVRILDWNIISRVQLWYIVSCIWNVQS